MKHFWIICIVHIFPCFFYAQDLSFYNIFDNSYNHYSNNKIKTFKVCGERCSGTNFLTCFIQKNFPNLTLEYRYGHKHALYWFNEPIKEEKLRQLKYSTEDASLYGSEECLFIVIVRDPYDWLRSFYLVPHHVHGALLSKGFFYFISNEWRATDECPEVKVIDSLNPITNLPFSNVIELRKYKNLNYLQLASLVENYLLVKYEDVRDNPEKFVRFVADYYNLETAKKFVPIHTYKDTDMPYTRKKYFDFSKEEIEFINDRLAWDVENSIGFTLQDTQ